jgi:hypothetical protein
MTGDARTAMPMAVRSTLTLVFIIGLTGFSAIYRPHAPYVASPLRRTKTLPVTKLCGAGYRVYVDLMRLGAACAGGYLTIGILINHGAIFRGDVAIR